MTIADDPIIRKTVLDLTDEQLDALLTEKRERRIKIVTRLREARVARPKIHNTNAGTKIDKHMAMLDKEITAIDTAIDKAEKRVLQIRALRLQWEDE